MGALDRSVAIFSTLCVTVVSLLVITGDKRPDVYVSLSAVLYFIYVSLDEKVRRSTQLTRLNIALLAAFTIAVAYRIGAILGWLH